MGELEAMGYSLAWRTELLKGAMVGYTRVLGKVSRGETERNRKGAATLMSRRFKKLIGNTEWFRSQDNQTDAEELIPPWTKQGQKRPNIEQ